VPSLVLTVPAIETLEKMARAIEVHLYQLFYDGEKPRDLPSVANRNAKSEWGSRGKDARFVHKMRGLLSKIDAGDRGLLLSFLQRVARRKSSRTSSKSEFLGPRNRATAST
jgi:hypothetical protein